MIKIYRIIQKIYQIKKKLIEEENNIVEEMEEFFNSDNFSKNEDLKDCCNSINYLTEKIYESPKLKDCKILGINLDEENSSKNNDFKENHENRALNKFRPIKRKACYPKDYEEEQIELKKKSHSKKKERLD